MWKIAGLVVYLAVLSIFDIRTRRLPVGLVAAGGAASLVCAAACLYGRPWAEIAFGAIQGLLPGILMLTMSRLSGKTGGGDGAVLLVMGGVLGTKTVPVFAAALLLSAVFAALLLITRRAGKNDRIPFVPFLTLSVVLVEAVHCCGLKGVV